MVLISTEMPPLRLARSCFPSMALKRKLIATHLIKRVTQQPAIATMRWLLPFWHSEVRVFHA